MNEALQRWREEFAREPDTAFDRLVRGLVPLGAAGQLSFGEVLDGLFEPGDTALDTAAARWLERHILGLLPDGTSLHRWVAVLEEYFRGIAAMELPKTGEILRRQHKRIRLWLHGFYEGPDRDPEGSYLLALTRAQDSQQFSPLWRSLILGDELAGRSYLGIGILGFRKMPEQDRREAADVPEGLVQALVELGDKPGTGQAKWKQTMRSLFATYRRSESYWVDHLAPLLPHYTQPSNAREWLSALLPGIPKWRPPIAETLVPVRRTTKVPVPVSREWAKRVRDNADLCDAPEFSAFLDQHRAYVETTGDPEYINKTFNNLSTAIIRADSGRSDYALSLIEEALEWAPWNPHNWTSYAIVLCSAHREEDAISALWEARHRFAWNPFIRTELGRILRENGDLTASEGVLREAVGHFPSDVVCRTALAQTLRAMERFEDARDVYEQACRDFLDDVICRKGLADLLIDLDDADGAERIYREVLEVDERDRYARGGLARALSIRSARTRDAELRDKAKGLLEELAYEGNHDARSRLQDFDEQWERATTDPTLTFRRETGELPPPARREQQGRAMAAMSVAERLGRAMILLWQAERATDATVRSSLCTPATALLDLREDKIDDDLLAAFVETRGLILLASGDARSALDYFQEQIRCYGRGGWIGIRLGKQRARILLGEPGDADDAVEAPSSQIARFALHVACVIQALAASPQESEVRDLLKSLYPRAAEFAARVRPDDQGGLAIESGAEMLGAFLQTRWFRPAGVQSVEDLDRPEALHAVIERINNTRTDTFDVISNSTMAQAA